MLPRFLQHFDSKGDFFVSNGNALLSTSLTNEEYPSLELIFKAKMWSGIAGNAIEALPKLKKLAPPPAKLAYTIDKLIKYAGAEWTADMLDRDKMGARKRWTFQNKDLTRENVLAVLNAHFKRTNGSSWNFDHLARNAGAVLADLAFFKALPNWLEFSAKYDLMFPVAAAAARSQPAAATARRSEASAESAFNDDFFLEHVHPDLAQLASGVMSPAPFAAATAEPTHAEEAVGDHSIPDGPEHAACRQAYQNLKLKCERMERDRELDRERMERDRVLDKERMERDRMLDRECLSKLENHIRKLESHISRL